MDQEELEQIIEQARLDPSLITTLDIQDNRSVQGYLRLPESIGALYNLTTLSLSNWDFGWNRNQLTSIPESIGSLSNLTNLNLHDNLLTTLPESIGNLHSLIELNLSNNQLEILPESLGNLSSLTKLDLSNYNDPSKYSSNRHYKGNHLENIPECIGNLSKLTELNLKSNQLSSLPESISNLSSLVTLDLSNNQLGSLPESMSNLSSLVTLDLSNNQLNTFPDSIENISQITINLLGEKSLKIRSKSKSVNTFSSLIDLSLASNQFTTIPESLCNLSKLVYLNLTNNPLTDLSILQKLPVLCNVYFLGVSLSRRYWTQLSDWKSEWLLDEDNIEVRRVLIEQLGYQTITEELNSLTIDTWREYTLLKIDKVNKVYSEITKTVNIEPMVLLKMTCPSTHHIHILRVPPEMTSAEAAITWVNHGIHPGEFVAQT